MLNASIEFHYVEKEHDVWLNSANSREEYGADFSAMYRTGPRRAIEIAAFKAKHEAVSKAKGPLGPQKVPNGPKCLRLTAMGSPESQYHTTNP